MKLRLLDTRDVYRPFQYPEFETIHRQLYTSFWHGDEVSLTEDVSDFKNKLSKDEKLIVSRILKNFVQSEIHVGCFWGDFVSSWFKHPEIQNVSRYISGNETIHSSSYDKLNTELGLDEYASLKEDKKLYARIKMLTQKKAKLNDDILRQIFTYSVMGEGVCLFSSFFTLFSFTKRGHLRNLGQIISWSSLDEEKHSEVGCRLFNTFKKEYNLIDDAMKKSLYDIAEEIVQMEDNLVDRVFEGLSTDVVRQDVVKNYIRYKANKQLSKVGLKKIFRVDKMLLKESEFFEVVVHGETVVDAFANKITEYSKGAIPFDDLVWVKEIKE